MIPLCDLKKQYSILRNDILEAIDFLCKDSAFINGKYLEKFEEEFTSSHNAKFGVGCANGTAALSIALEAIGIGRGDDVLLPSHTFVATAEAVCHVGATPIFCDIRPDDYTINIDDIKQKITPNTKAIIPVHIYGTPCDMGTIMGFAQENNLLIVEDCAQSHFAKYDDQHIGTFGNAAGFSFYPGKNVGAYGDAGFMFFKNADHAQIAQRLINHGRLDKFDHEIIGYNQRLDPIQAVILSIKLKHMHIWTKRRQEIASKYDEAFAKIGVKTITASSNKVGVYHVYNIEVSNRDNLRDVLKIEGIATGIHYPQPVHKMKPFLKYARSPLPITEAISPRILSLPIYPELTDKEQLKVIDFVLKSAKP